MPGIEWIAGVPQSNYKRGREGNPVGVIVDHWMAGSFASALARFMNPQQIVSAHFLIGTGGRIAQIVPTDDTAYHAGDWDTNLRAIGIEHEASPTIPPSDTLYRASGWLHSQLAGIYDLPLEVGLTVKGHRDIVPTACPGTLDLDHIVALARLEDELTPEEARAIAEKAIADAGLDPNTIETIKKLLNKHIHPLVPDANQTSTPLVPPVKGALYAGQSADGTQVFWVYPGETTPRA